MRISSLISSTDYSSLMRENSTAAAVRSFKVTSVLDLPALLFTDRADCDEQ
jgi:hypothetical protein